jgi:hypothetical protein
VNDDNRTYFGLLYRTRRLGAWGTGTGSPQMFSVRG